MLVSGYLLCSEDCTCQTTYDACAVHDSQKPECAQATVTGPFALTSGYEVLGAEAFDLCPFGHMERE